LYSFICQDPYTCTNNFVIWPNVTYGRDGFSKNFDLSDRMIAVETSGNSTGKNKEEK